MTLTRIGKIAGVDLMVESEDERVVETVKAFLGDNQFIYFDGYPDGHHPVFFEKYPELKKYRDNNLTV